MSIASEIARLESAKSAIADAIISKGGSVPANTKLDAFPACIDGIPSGETQYALWMGYSQSIYVKATSTRYSASAYATVSAPTGCSIYAYKRVSDTNTASYSTSTVYSNSYYYRMQAETYKTLCDINKEKITYCSSYIPTITYSISQYSTYSMFCIGVATMAFGITDTVVQDSILIYSRSTVVSSFFTGLTTPFSGVNASLLKSIPAEAFANNYQLNSVNIPQCSYIASSAFYACKSLSSISFPSCSYIGSSAFYGCSKLTSVNIPNCTSIGNHAFAYCSKLSSISFPSCTLVGIGAFEDCYSLISVNIPNCTSIGANAFYSCSKLASVNFPSCSYIGNSTFGSCSKLTSVNIPNCTSVGNYAFEYCSKLTSVNFPMCNYVGNSTFRNCYSLALINFPICLSIGENAFAYCYNLISLNLIEVSSVPTLGTTAFTSTPIGDYSESAGRYGSVYVPASLYSDFIIATNWSDISSRIVGVDQFVILYYNNEYSKQYSYEMSMTWNDWVNSDYNTEGFSVYNNYYIAKWDDMNSHYAILEDSMGEEISISDDIANTEGVANGDGVYMPMYLSVSSFMVTTSNTSKFYDYGISMTWNDWINSNYNVDNFVIDDETGYVAIWDSGNSEYIYLVDSNTTTNKMSSTNSILSDVQTYAANFYISATL